MLRELINTCHGFLGVTGRDGGVLELMQRIAIESMVWTASDTAYIKQCTCKGDWSLEVTVECSLMCCIAIDARKWHEIDTDTSMRHVWER